MGLHGYPNEEELIFLNLKVGLELRTKLSTLNTHFSSLLSLSCAQHSEQVSTPEDRKSLSHTQCTVLADKVPPASSSLSLFFSPPALSVIRTHSPTHVQHTTHKHTHTHTAGALELQCPSGSF